MISEIKMVNFKLSNENNVKCEMWIDHHDVWYKEDLSSHGGEWGAYSMGGILADRRGTHSKGKDLQ